MAINYDKCWNKWKYREKGHLLKIGLVISSFESLRVNRNYSAMNVRRISQAGKQHITHISD